MEDNKKIIKTIQRLDWNLVSYFMQMFYWFTAVMQDEGFRERFDSLYKYVSSKIVTPYKGDRTDEYVIVEQEATSDEEYKAWLKSNKN
ncbi:MAG: hypothetical protein HDT32_06520 [Clostridiales bacterium]|nr:hypothetical protein [Clostridiales bacterium]